MEQKYNYKSGATAIYISDNACAKTVINNNILEYTGQYATYDIETNNIEATRSYKGIEQRELIAEPYLFQLGYGTTAIITHSRKQFIELIQELQKHVSRISCITKHRTKVSNKKLYLFAHNGQSFDSAFFMDLVMESEDKRMIIPENGVMRFMWRNIEFRDTVKTMIGSLDKVIKDYTDGKFAKLDTLEHDNNHSYEYGSLTKDELEYATNDVVGLWAAITGYMDLMIGNRNIRQFPLTECSGLKKNYYKRLDEYKTKDAKFYYKHRNRLNNLKDYDLSKLLAIGFKGGNTGVGKDAAGVIYKSDENRMIVGADITSAHPGQKVRKLYATGQIRRINNPTVDMVERLAKYQYTHKVGFYGNFILKFKVKDIIKTSSFGVKLDDVLAQNLFDKSNDIWGSKAQRSEHLVYQMDNTDFITAMEQCEEFEIVKVLELYTYGLSRLSKLELALVSEAFKNKTKYKDVDGKETEYNQAKITLNTGSFGMDAKKDLPDVYELDNGEIINIGQTTKEDWEKTNKGFYKNTTPRIWGYQTASHTRRQQICFINKIQERIPNSIVIKYDTDSVTAQIDRKDYSLWKQILEEENGIILEELKTACIATRTPFESLIDVPKPNGGTSTLGYWEEEHIDAEFFMPIGTKHYVYKNKGEETEMKCAGMTPEIVWEKMKEVAGGTDLEVLEYWSGKSIHITEEDNVRIAAKLGKKPKLLKRRVNNSIFLGKTIKGRLIESPSYVSLTPAKYTLSPMNETYVFDVWQKMLNTETKKLIKYRKIL